jgi:predicted transcriptional regulator
LRTGGGGTREEGQEWKKEGRKEGRKEVEKGRTVNDEVVIAVVMSVQRR